MTTVAMITHSRPFLGQEEIQAVTDVLKSGQLAQGPFVERFEQGLAATMGLKGGVAVSSGTAALELALRALEVGPGDEVIMPSYVCAAPWLATSRVGAHPRLVDVELDTFALDPDRVQKAMTPRTKAIIVPHLFGLPADMERLQRLGVTLIEDCAQTVGAMVMDRPVGTVGALAVCSFYATKLLCTGEGGMILSNDESILERARTLREYDEAPSLQPLSYNYKLTDLQGALGLVQLERFHALLERRAAIAAQYDHALDGANAVRPVIPEGRTHVFYRYVVRIPKLLTNKGKLADLLSRLEHRGVQCRRPVFQALHRYLNVDGFPVTEEVSETAVSIPIYPSMTDDEVKAVARVVREELH